MYEQIRVFEMLLRVKYTVNYCDRASMDLETNKNQYRCVCVGEGGGGWRTPHAPFDSDPNNVITTLY